MADRVAAVVAWSCAAMVAGVFGWLLADLVWHGMPRLSWAFVVEAPRRAGTAGGIGPILVSTGLILAVCLAAAVPIALGAGIFLAEFAPRSGLAGRLVRGSLDVLAAVPSIVFGLFGNALFCQMLGLGFSILSGGLTLACMVLPLLVRSAEQALRAVAEEHRRGAAALGLSRWAALRGVLLPAAAPGIAAGLILAVSRAVAETAALIYTSGYVERLPRSLFDSGRALSVHIYDLEMNVSGGEPNAYASALVLMASLLVLGWLAARLSSRWLGQEKS